MAPGCLPATTSLAAAAVIYWQARTASLVSSTGSHTLQLQAHRCCFVSCACQVVDLAMWLETSKMDPALTGNLLGGGLLGDILTHMTAAEQAVQSSSKVRRDRRG